MRFLSGQRSRQTSGMRVVVLASMIRRRLAQPQGSCGSSFLTVPAVGVTRSVSARLFIVPSPSWVPARRGWTSTDRGSLGRSSRLPHTGVAREDGRVSGHEVTAMRSVPQLQLMNARRRAAGSRRPRRPASTVPPRICGSGVSAACCRAAAAGWAFDAGAPAPVMVRSRCTRSTRAWLRPPRSHRPRRVGSGEDAASGTHPLCALPVPAVGARRRGRFVDGLPERRPCDRLPCALAPRSSSRWCADAGSMRSPCGRTQRMTRAGVCGDVERSR